MCSMSQEDALWGRVEALIVSVDTHTVHVEKGASSSNSTSTLSPDPPFPWVTGLS